MMPVPTRILAAGLAAALAGCAASPARDTVAVAPGDHVASDAAWAALDGDHDGGLSPHELAEQHALMLLQDFAAADAGRDGTVSRAEWDAWWPRLVRTPPSPTMQVLNAGGFAGAGSR
mgnify:FL=1